MELKISFDLGTVLKVTAAVNKQVFPLLNQAVRAVAQATAINWQNEVYKAKLWSGEKDQYAQSITWKMTGDFAAVVETTYKYAEEIESGRPSRDLKAMLGTSKKVRRAKDGKRYLIIPFRHNTPGNDAHAASMPKDVYDIAKDMEISFVTGQQNRVSGQVSAQYQQRWDAVASSRNARGVGPGSSKFLVNQNRYKWGGRLPAGLAPKLKPEHTTDIYAGMVKMNTSTPGGSKSSSYLTFRVMKEGSPKWVVPAQPGQHLAKKVSDDMAPKAQQAFAMAIKKQLSK